MLIPVRCAWACSDRQGIARKCSDLEQRVSTTARSHWLRNTSRTSRYLDVGQGIARHLPVQFPGCEDQWRNPMCDYSLHAVASRPAKVGETLVTTSFYGTSTRGFASKAEPGVAVCFLPGTELAFEHDVRYNRNWLSTKSAGFRVARFCSIEPDAPHQHMPSRFRTERRFP